MQLKNKKIGVWGLGLVGQAAMRFLSHQRAQLSIWDQKQLPKTIADMAHQLGVTYQPNQAIQAFLADNELIMPSPGIDVRPYSQYHSKIICELDLFAHFFNKPVIAITGTIGKTTVTTLLSQALQKAGKRVLTGGNIGTPLLDLIDQQKNADLAVIELSSFQLEYSTFFAPDLAIWTNFYPNHLDRHSTPEEYFNAKLKLTSYQKADQHLLLPHNMTPSVATKSKAHILSTSTNTANANYYLSKNSIYKNDKKLIELPEKQTTFTENIITICAALDIMGINPTPSLLTTNNTPPELEHRLEYVATRNGITFYNDSKSTITESTMAAIQRLQSHSLILLLGGLSKGVNRESFIAHLPQHVRHVTCFGKEAESLHHLCKLYKQASSSCKTLEEAIATSLRYAHVGNTILLSPGGSSFDLFSNYKERGKRFKELVLLGE